MTDARVGGELCERKAGCKLANRHPVLTFGRAGSGFYVRGRHALLVNTMPTSLPTYLYLYLVKVRRWYRRRSFAVTLDDDDYVSRLLRFEYRQYWFCETILIMFYCRFRSVGKLNLNQPGGRVTSFYFNDTQFYEYLAVIDSPRVGPTRAFF